MWDEKIVSFRCELGLHNLNFLSVKVPLKRKLPCKSGHFEMMATHKDLRGKLMKGEKCGLEKHYFTIAVQHEKAL